MLFSIGFDHAISHCIFRLMQSIWNLWKFLLRKQSHPSRQNFSPKDVQTPKGKLSPIITFSPPPPLQRPIAVLGMPLPMTTGL